MLENKLKNEYSLYLLEHKNNPVAWQPFTYQITETAEKENKPILLSIGYSSCHWCHVMADESFSDNETAEFINENFIPVKIDREEYPDIDKKYQFFLQIIRQMGGWPLTVFTDPDLTPFYGGTYFPKNEIQGIPAFLNVLKAVSELYKNNDSKLDKIRGNYRNFIKRFNQTDSDFNDFQNYTKEKEISSFMDQADRQQGGLKGNSKFPNIPVMNYLLSFAENDENIMKFLKKTADQLCSSGIFDHINGGFYRYCVDSSWNMPHFEKMLYDNALNAEFLTKLYDVTKDPLYLHIARKAADFILEYFSTDFGLAASMNADSPDENNNLVEGYYYKIFENDIPANFSENEKQLIHNHFVFKENVLNLQDIDYEKYVKIEPVFEKIQNSINKEKPVLDTKVIISWNMLFVNTLLTLSEMTNDEYYFQMAVNLYNKVKNYLINDDGSLFRIKYHKDLAFNHRTLEDYAYSIDTTMRMFEMTKDRVMLDFAVKLTKKMFEIFRENGVLFFDTNHDVSDTFDEAVPSAFAVALKNSEHLSEISDINGDIVGKLKDFGADRVLKFPAGHPTLLNYFKFGA